jgi:GGDEF domain-containing protein
VAQLAAKERERAARQNEFVQELRARIAQLERVNTKTDENGMEVAAPVPLIDALTGVMSGAAAREAILNAQADDHPAHLAVIHIQSLNVLNTRFGQRIGDQIVLTCCQHLANNLCRERDRIFRWRGPAFVALLERDDSPAGVGREVSHTCNAIPSGFFGEPHRSILIPVRMTSTTVPLEGRLITDVFDAIERFIARAERLPG